MHTQREKKLLKTALLLPLAIISLGSLYAMVLSPRAHTTLPTKSIPHQEKVLGYETPELRITSNQDYYRDSLIISQSMYAKPEIQVSAYNASSSGTLRVYEADTQDILTFIKKDETDNLLSVNNITTDNRQQLLETKVELKKPDSDNAPIMLPLESQSGIWLLELQYKEFKKQTLLIRSGYGIFTANTERDLLFWAQDFKTGKSVSDVKIDIYNITGSQTKLTTRITNDKGILGVEIDERMEIALADHDGDTAFVPINTSPYIYGRFEKTEPQTQYFTFTDRPLYKPGDTVSFKSIIREDLDKKYSIKNKKIYVTVKNSSYGDINIFEKQYTVSPTGDIHGEFQIPKDAKTGNYELRIIPQDNGDTYGNASYTYFNVNYYRKPEYSISITVPQIEVIRQDTVQAKIKAAYFSGVPVRNRDVEYSIQGCSYADYQHIAFTQSEEYWYWGWCETKITKGTIRLDNKGEAILSLNTDLQPNTGSPLVWNIQVTLNDGSRNTVQDSANILVRQAQWGIYPNDYASYPVVNKQQTIPIEIKPYSDTAIGIIQLEKNIKLTKWEKYNDPKYKYPQYKEKTIQIEKKQINIDGAGTSSIIFIPPEEGQYTITLTGQDTKGNMVIKNVYLYASAHEWIYQHRTSNTSELPITISTDKSEFMPDEKVKTYINLDGLKDRDALITIEGRYVDRYQVISIPGEAATTDIELTPTDVPNRFFTVRTFTDQDLVSDSKNIIIGKNTKKLNISITPQTTETAPGQTIAVNIQTRDSAGNPIPANVALWGVDKALFELVSSNLGNIYERFWSERYIFTNTSNSLLGLNESGYGGGGGCFTEDTLISMADGTSKKIKEIKKGDRIKTRTSETDSRLITAQVTHVFEHDVQGYLILNGTIKITPEHILYVNNQWRQAGHVKIGDELARVDNKKIKVTSIKWINTKAKVYNLEVEKYHTFFANNVWVHNQKGDGDVRDTFKDTSYWNPSIQTDTNGQATVQVTLPDNLTTWVFTAVGDTQDTKVGQTYAEVTTNKQIVVRPVLPNIVRVNDKIKLSTMVYNGTDKEHTFNVSLQYPAAEIINATQSATIKPKDTVQLYFDATITKEDQSGVTVSAINNNDKNMGDRVKMPLPVRPFEVIIQKGESAANDHTYTLQTFPDTDKTKSEVTITFASDLTQNMKSAIQYLIRYPYGCTEQTMSRLVPIIIAKKYQGVFAQELKDQKFDSDDMLAKGFNRLFINQKSDGGWSWWGAGPSDIFVTAYVIEHLELAKQTGIPFEPEILDNAKEFITRFKPNSEREIIYKSYAQSLWDKNTAQIPLETMKKVPTEILVYAVLTNQRLGNKNAATNGLNLLRSKAIVQGDTIRWSVSNTLDFNSDFATTALAVRALHANTTYQDEIDKALKYIARNKKNEYWANSFASAQIMRMVAEVEESKPQNDYTYSLTLNNNQIARGSVTKTNNTIPTITIDGKKLASASAIQVTKTGTGTLYSTLRFKQTRTATDLPPQNNGLSIKRSYISEKGTNYSLGVGDKVTVQLVINGLKEPEKYAVVQDELPAGLVPINKNFNNEVENSTYNYYYDANNYDSEYTENGIIMRLYNLYPSHTVSYEARVISEGTFNAPPAFASLMYAPEINATSQTDTITTESDARKLADLPPYSQGNWQANKTLQSKIITAEGYALYLGVAILAVLSAYLFEKYRKK